jgi:DNA-binding NarL/FixJ family response regulator
VKRIRIVVADDHPLFVAGVRAALSVAGDIEVVGVASAGTKVVPLIASSQPDFVLLDYLMPQLDGLACLVTIQSRHPNVKVAMMSGVRDPGVIEAALRRGACAFVLKSIDPDDLAAVIRQVMNGTVFQTLDLGEPERVESNGRRGGLTGRELSILAALGQGLSNDAIAKEFWITRETVKSHVRNIYRKLEVSNRTEAAHYAYQHGLVPSLAENGDLPRLSVSQS